MTVESYIDLVKNPLIEIRVVEKIEESKYTEMLEEGDLGIDRNMINHIFKESIN